MWMFLLQFKWFFYSNSSAMTESTRWIHSRLSRRVRSAKATLWVLCFFSPHPPIVMLFTPSLRRLWERKKKNLTFHVFAHVSYPGCENSRGYNKACGWSCICPCDVLGFLKLFWVMRSCVWLVQKKFTSCFKQSRICRCRKLGVLVLH